MADFEELDTVASVIGQNDLEPDLIDDGFDEYLIEEVKKYRILWDTSSRGYKDLMKKNQAWSEISSKLQEDCMYILIVY